MGAQASETQDGSDPVDNLQRETVRLLGEGKTAEAEGVARQALALAEQSTGKDSLLTATSLHNLAFALRMLNRLDEAEQLNRRALSIREKSLPERHFDIGRTLNELGLVLWELRRLDEAEQLHRRALEIFEQALPSNDPDVANSLNNLGLVLWRQNRLDEAEQAFRRSMSIRERLPNNENELATNISNLGLVLLTLNRVEEAESLFRRALAILQGMQPANDSLIALCLQNLGDVLRRLDRLDEAEESVRRALVMLEQILPEDHPNIAGALSLLGTVLSDQRRFREAEPVTRRALAIRERTLPEGHLEISVSLNNLAVVLAPLGRLEETEQIHRRVLAMLEKSLPPDHPDIAQSLDNLAETLRLLKRYEEAEKLERRALSMRERSLPADHPLIAESLNNLALIQAFNRPAEVESLYRRALAIRERSLPEDHTKIAETLENWALFSIGEGKLEQTLELSYRADDIRSVDKNRARTNWRWHAALQADVADRMIKKNGGKLTEFIRNARRAAFQNLQWERSGGTGGAIASATARARSADSKVASLARERDRVAVEIARLDASFLSVSSAQDSGRAKRTKQLADLRSRSDTARERLAAIDKEIAERFPAFAELSGGTPLAAHNLMPFLAEDEVLVSITPYGEWGFFYAYDAKTGSFAWIKEAGTAGMLAARLRCSAAAGLDPSCASQPASEGGGQTRSAVALQAGDTPQKLFDLDLAYDLYRRMFPETGRKFISGKKLIIVPAPELMGLPWHLLLTEPPPKGWNEPGANMAKIYREAKWLFQSHPSITVLPTVNSLRAFRRSAEERKTAERAFLGIGDPVIGRSQGERDALPMDCGQQEKPVLVASQQPEVLAARSAAAAPAGLFSGERDEDGFTLADPALVRMQPRLPDTRCELMAVAASVATSSGRADLLLGAEASERRIREINEAGDLARYGVIQFATHGLLGGELGLGEPGLVLTPPEKASAEDDGILTASEIAALNLSADWVVLSACNTAAGGDANTEALSGLARSFFYAGAKSLLVSSWPVYSSAAVEITTRAFTAMERDPAMGRSEALTLSMRDLLASASNEFTAHPGYWAPFFLVGEGSR